MDACAKTSLTVSWLRLGGAKRNREAAVMGKEGIEEAVLPGASADGDLSMAQDTGELVARTAKARLAAPADPQHLTVGYVFNRGLMW